MTPRSTRRILAAVDFSAPSVAAFDHAVRLYERFGSHLTAVHVIEPRRLLRVTPSAPQPVVLSKDGGANRLYAGDELRAIAERLGLVVSLSTRLLVCSGDPANLVCCAAGELRADLLYCGTTGRGGARGLGRVARRLLAMAPCKVVPVSADARGTLPHVTDCPA